MNKPTLSAIVTLLMALLTALSSVACRGEAENTDAQRSQLDGGTPEEDASTPEDTASDADASLSDTTRADTSDASDTADTFDTTDDVDRDTAPPPEATLAQGIELVGIQAFQTVETTLVEGGVFANSNIPLIAGRETLFRILVAPEAGWTPREVTAQIVLIEADTGESQTLTQTLEVTQASQPDPSHPDRRSSAFEIRVPEGVITPQTSASFRLVGDGVVGTESSTQSAARWPRDNSAMPLDASDTTGKLHLVLVPMQYDYDGSGRLPDTSPQQLAHFKDLLRAIYPASELLVEVRQPISWNSPVDWGDFNRKMRSLKASDGADEAYYYGIIKPAETFGEYCNGSCTTGQSFTVSSAGSTSYRVGSGLGFSGERWAWTLVHELGHMHGRGHAPCGVSWWSEDHSYPYGDGTVGVWGWDRRTDSLFAPGDVTDFMGYCDDLWVSDYTYLGLVDRMRDAHALQQAMSLTPETTWRYVNWSDAKPPRWGRSTRERNPTTGEWAQVSFMDAQRNTLLQRQVPLIRYAHEGERSVLVPEAPEDAARIEIATSAKTFSLQLP